MPMGSIPDDLYNQLPTSFFERIVRDIPARTWLHILQDHHSLKEKVLEGFSIPVPRLLPHLENPQILKRIERFVRPKKALLEEILQVWGHEQSATVAYLEMLDPQFVLENWIPLKNLVGPERFFAGLYLLQHLEEAEFRDLVDESFWERSASKDVMELLVPIWAVWKDFTASHPQASDWEASAQGEGEAPKRPPSKDDRQLAARVQQLETRCRKLEDKLSAAKTERASLQEAMARTHTENETLRKRLAEQEEGFSARLHAALSQERSRWFQRYRVTDEEPARKESERVDDLLKRAERALELQKATDEQFGVIPVLRRKFFQIAAYLQEIERVYAESLVVHTEVSRVKSALLAARRQILQLPGIEKVLSGQSSSQPCPDFLQFIRLLDIHLDNLPKVIELERIIPRLAELGLLEDSDALRDEVVHKRRQIMEVLYAEHRPEPSAIPPSGVFRFLEDFIHSGKSKGFDVFVDVYNVLLRIWKADRKVPSGSLISLREDFIAAVSRKSRVFRKVILVFDGQEDSRKPLGNVEVVYTDKDRGHSADGFIIDSITRRRDRKVLLVTEDHEIIKATENRLYALIDPLDFYFFVNDVLFPGPPLEVNS